MADKEVSGRGGWGGRSLSHLLSSIFHSIFYDLSIIFDLLLFIFYLLCSICYLRQKTQPRDGAQSKQKTPAGTLHALCRQDDEHAWHANETKPINFPVTGRGWGCGKHNRLLPLSLRNSAANLGNRLLFQQPSAKQTLPRDGVS